MSAVDVLRVLDHSMAACGEHDCEDCANLRKARAAVANLIDAATAASGIVRLSGLHCLRLDAALAACKGETP